MLQGRLFLRYFILIGYLGATLGMLMGQGMEDEERFVIAFIAFLVGIITHYNSKNLGFYISITINSLAVGAIVTFVMEFFGVNMNTFDILVSSGVLLVTYIILIYLASWKAGRNFGFTLSAFLVIGTYILLAVLYNSDVNIFKTMFFVQHIGVLYMVTLWITGMKSEMLLYNCSTASFILLGFVLIIAVLVAAASADSDFDIDFDGDGIFSRGRGYRRSHYYYHSYYYYDALYFTDLGRRRDNYYRKRLEKDEEDYNKRKREGETFTYQQQEKETYTNQDEVYPKQNEDTKKYDKNEWDY